MNAQFFVRREFADTRIGPQRELALGFAADPFQQLVLADRADWTLLRLVLCSASATLLIALACSLAV